jgi:hypothetical protein
MEVLMLQLRTAIVFIFLLLISCSSASVPTTDVPNLDQSADLSTLDVSVTQSEVLRLLGDGHVMYLKVESFNKSGHQSQACLPAQVIGGDCTLWPEKLVIETWMTTNASGTVDIFYGRHRTPDGELLATGINGEWTDSATGDTWTAGPLTGPDLVGQVEGLSTVIENVTATFPDLVTEGNYLGRPSIIVPRSLENEYQVANPMLSRETRWQEAGDGTRSMISEVKFVEIAMLPPGSFPAFATAEN